MAETAASGEVYFDYACPYSNRAQLWLDEAGARLDFRPFSLAEAHRPEGEPAVWDAPLDRLDPSLLALAGHELVRFRGGDLDEYRRRMFAWWHREEEPSLEGLWDLVETHAGLPISEGEVAAAVAAVALSHQDGEALGVFGTPTVFVGGKGNGFFVKLADQPPDRAAAAALWTRVRAFAGTHPELLELKRPEPPRRA